MRYANWARTAIRTAGLIVLCLVAGYVLLQSLSHFPGAPGEPVSAPPAAPPSAARDSLNRVVWIEGGIVLRGSHNPGKSENPASPYYTGDERPPDSTTVAGFWMQEHEVTNAEYRRFNPGHQFPDGRERHPVVDITLPEAMEYAAAVGGRLPTEAQWELAAEGTENRKYPWGNRRRHAIGRSTAPAAARTEASKSCPGRTGPPLMASMTWRGTSGSGWSPPGSSRTGRQ